MFSVLALSTFGCTANEDVETVPVSELPPGIDGKADSGNLHLAANNCEVFVDRVSTSLGARYLASNVLYLKTLNFRVDGDVTEVGMYGQVTTEGTCGIYDVCQHQDEWRPYPASRWSGASDYWRLDLNVNHSSTDPVTYEGVFYARTSAGTTYWVNPEGGGNFFIDSNMLNNIEDQLGHPRLRTANPEDSLVTADQFQYLSPLGCR